MKLAEFYEFESQASVAKTGAAICLSNLLEQQHVMNAAREMKVSPTTFSVESHDVRHLRAFEFIVAEEHIAQTLFLLFEEHEEDGDGMSPALIAVTRLDTEEPPKAPAIDCNFDGILRFPMTQQKSLVNSRSSCTLTARSQSAIRRLGESSD